MGLASKLIVTALVVTGLTHDAWAGRVAGRVAFDREVAEPLPEDASTADRQRFRAANKVAVWIDGVRDAEPVQEHAQLLQGGSQFYPPLLVAVAGQTVDIINNDNVVHGAYSRSKANPFDTGLKQEGEKVEIELKNPGLVRVGCPIHDDMAAMILVVPSSFHAVVDPGQPFVIPDLPAGEYRLSAWRDGYGKQSLTITVPEDGAASANFELAARGGDEGAAADPGPAAPDAPETVQTADASGAGA